MTADDGLEPAEGADHEQQLLDMRHELGNASLLLDAALRVLQERSFADDDDVRRLLDDVKRRIDTLAR